MTGRIAGPPEGVYDQPGGIAVRFREERSVQRARSLQRRGRLAPPPGAERLQCPSTIVSLTTLNLRDQRFALRFCQQVVQPSRRQQQPNPIEEALRRVLFLQISAQPLYARSCLRGVIIGGARHDSDGQGRKCGAVVGAVNALEWLKPEIEPVPRTIGALCLPHPVEGLLGRSAWLSPALRSVGAREDQSVDHRLGPTRLRLFTLVEVVKELMSVIALDATRSFLDESLFLGRCGRRLHRPSEGRPCHHVRNCCVTGDAGRLRLASPELLGSGEPDFHPLVQVFRGAFPIPVPGRIPSILWSSVSSD